MPPRFHAPDAARTGARVELPREEGAHLARVLRLGPGDAVRVFDGAGREFEAVVEEAIRDRVVVRLGPAVTAAREARVAVTLALAVLKGDRMDEAIRDAVMLGAAAIQPMLTARTETSAAVLARGRRQERWQAVAVAAAKQSGRAVVPPVAPPVDLDAVLGSVAGAVDGAAIVCVEPQLDVARLDAVPPEPPRRATVLVGPEGGWTPMERARAVALCQPITLGGRVIRADAMPLVVLTALFTRWREF